jgi:serine/threonine-protein phosphatase 2A regulatory subunit A
VEHVGGPAHARHLLVPLEQLAMVEEMTVRDMAIKSMNGVATRMVDAHFGEFFVPLIERLAGKDW